MIIKRGKDSIFRVFNNLIIVMFKEVDKTCPFNQVYPVQSEISELGRVARKVGEFRPNIIKKGIHYIYYTWV